MRLLGLWARTLLSKTTRSVFLVIVAIIGLSSACSNDDPTTSHERTPSSSSTITTVASTATSEQQESSSTTAPSSSQSDPTRELIVARYLGFWESRLEANSGTPNPADPNLRQFATGEQLEAVVAETQANLDAGLSFRPSTSPTNIQQVEVIEIDGDHAVVQECVVSDDVVIRRDSGEIVDDQVSTHSVKGEMLSVDGVWKVSSAELIQRWDGVAGCALDS